MTGTAEPEQRERLGAVGTLCMAKHTLSEPSLLLIAELRAPETNLGQRIGTHSREA